ncbi:MAG TPA: DUF1549 and DUF1553 domain-containing protein [Bryobacteraceae bacterium]|nr:DUF1549 and DUF1553 domain-containing protein [Bryobacteraceae bacterium]
MARLAKFAAILLAATSLTAWVDKDAASVLARRNWWAFQKPARPPVPHGGAWARTPIDAFILEGLQSKKLSPSAPLDRQKLLRRVTYDLTGLPPTPGEVDLFLRDRGPDAYEKVVDRLLASPHYGERWALRWLDLVRYADTNGYELDAERPHAWRYRDYVVAAFNQDKPYDRFIREQIAGDELYPGNQEALIATGFHRCGPIHLVGGNQDPEVTRQEVLTEMTSSIGSVFLGLTVGCARCHNHKFDPILQSDYYRLQAVFAATEGKDVEIYTPEQKAAFDKEVRDYEARLKPIKDALERIDKPARERLIEGAKQKLEPSLREALQIPKAERNTVQAELAKNAEAQIKPLWNEVVDALSPEDLARRRELRVKLHEIEKTKPAPLPAAYAVADMEKAAPPTFILKVGDPKNKLGQVEPGVPLALDPLAPNGTTPVPVQAAGRRAALANWLASVENPLAARVMVNRIWQFRMGEGLVRTPNDFGVLGERSAQHQKLLDWLAVEFMERGWSVKAMDRLIVLSSVYRQAAAEDKAKSAIDPDNRYFWRMNRKRMEAEILRDSVLAVAGSLNPRLGGRPVRVPIEPEVYDLIFTEGERDGLWPVAPESEQGRRSLYLLNKRSVRLPMMMAFDQPDTMTSCPVRPTSTHALQALTLFNSDFMQQQSARLASRLERECGGSRDCELQRAYKLALARPPQPAEVAMAKRFFRAGGELADFCLALMNRNEFVYIP